MLCRVSDEPTGILLGLYDDGLLRYVGKAHVPVGLGAGVLATLRRLSASQFHRGTPGRGRRERRPKDWVPVVPDRVAEVGYTAVSSGSSAASTGWRERGQSISACSSSREDSLVTPSGGGSGYDAPPASGSPGRTRWTASIPTDRAPTTSDS